MQAGHGSSRTPSLIMALAPPCIFFSAGWTMSLTVPENLND
jgi:hypothetical protein